MPMLRASIPLAHSGLDLGYRQMYNLDFGAAHHTFNEWKEHHPDDPLGPVSHAAAYLFAEFDRLNILQSELFVSNDKFLASRKPAPDPDVKKAFDAELARASELADRALARSPDDRNAMFAKLLCIGLRSDYQGLIEKRYLASLSEMKNARDLAERLVARDPSYYDAYLAIGVENYMLSLKPMPVRWLLRMGGARTDKEEGLRKLHLTAEKGHYLRPFARLLLAVAALRDHKPAQARDILQELAYEFPRNQLYRSELSRLR
jgi:hypothetical protein